MTSVLNVDTIAAKDGTSPVALTKLEALKSYGTVDDTGTAQYSGNFNVSSVADNGTSGKRFNFTSSFAASPNGAVGQYAIASRGNSAGFTYQESLGTGFINVQYYDGSSYVDTGASIYAVGDLA